MPSRSFLWPNVPPPWSSSWPCGARLVVVIELVPLIAVGACRSFSRLCVPPHSLLWPWVPPRSSSCGAPLALVAVGAPPLVLVVPRLAVGGPRSSWWPCRGHVVPPWPSWLCVAHPGCRGHVVSPAGPSGRVEPPPGRRRGRVGPRLPSWPLVPLPLAHPRGALLGHWWPPIIVVAVSWPCGAPPIVQAVWCPSCSSLWPCGVPLVIIMELVPPPHSSSLLWVPPTHPQGRGCIRAWCPPIGCGCGGRFVVMVVVKGRAVNRQDTYYIRMPPHDLADRSAPLLFV